MAGKKYDNPVGFPSIRVLIGNVFFLIVLKKGDFLPFPVSFYERAFKNRS